MYPGDPESRLWCIYHRNRVDFISTTIHVNMGDGEEYEDVGSDGSETSEDFEIDDEYQSDNE